MQLINKLTNIKICNLAISSFVCLIYCIFCCVPISNTIGNIGFYITLCLLFFAGIIISSLFTNKALSSSKNNSKTWTIISLVLVLFVFCYCCLFQILTLYGTPLDGKSLQEIAAKIPYGNILIIAGFIFMAIAAVIFVLISRFIVKKKSTAKTSTAFRVVFIVVLGVLQGSFLFCINFYLDDMNHYFHIHAYATSIINVIYNTPFNEITSSIYGHYALIFMPFVKLFMLFTNNEWFCITSSIAVIGAIIFIIQLYLISKICKSNLSFIIAALANTFISFALFFNQGYQLVPHRILCPTLCLFIIYQFQHTKISFWVKYAISLIASTLLILWNLETGLVCIFVLCLYFVVQIVSDNTKAKALKILLSVLIPILSFIFAYLIVYAYNICVGADPETIRSFIYPYFSEKYKIENLQMTLSLSNSVELIMVFIMLFGLVVSFINTIKNNHDHNAFLCLCVSLIGLGCFTYYINRPWYSNAAISLFSVVFIIAYFCESNTIKNYCTSSNNKLVQISSVFLLLVLATSSVLMFGPTLYHRTKTTYNYQSCLPFNNQVKENVDSSAAAIGDCANLVFASIGYDGKIHTQDYWDIYDVAGFLDKDNFVNNPSADQYIKDEVESGQYRYLFVSSGFSNLVPQTYSVIDDFSYGPASFLLYEYNGS